MGGFSTKIHAVCDALGNPLHFMVTAGQKHDAPLAIPLIQAFTAEHLLADKGYDSDAIREFATEKGITPQIPPKKNRKEERLYDKHLYKERHKIECLFDFLKHYRRLLARFDTLKGTSLPFCILSLLYNGLNEIST